MSQSHVTQPRSGRSQVLFWGLIALAIVVVIVIRHGMGPNLNQQGRNHPAVGQPLMAVQLIGLTGASTDVDLESLKGKIVLINFWGTWCGPCRYELPHIAAIRSELAADPEVRILAVSCGQREPEDIQSLREATRQFLTEKNLDLPTYADPTGTTRKAVGMALGEGDLQSLPTTVLIDRNSIVRAVWLGYGEGVELDMRKAIEEVQKGKAYGGMK